MLTCLQTVKAKRKWRDNDRMVIGLFRLLAGTHTSIIYEGLRVRKLKLCWIRYDIKVSGFIMNEWMNEEWFPKKDKKERWKLCVNGHACVWLHDRVCVWVCHAFAPVLFVSKKSERSGGIDYVRARLSAKLPPSFCVRVCACASVCVFLLNVSACLSRNGQQ